MFRKELKFMKKGFTLAEVLITLGIIGVVAAMTMPTLINNINNKQNIAALKKAYSLISQAGVDVIRENGSLANLCEANDTDCVRDLFKGSLKVVKTCDKGAIEGNCWVHLNEWKRLNGDAAWSMESKAGVILNDGMFVLFGYRSPNCNFVDGIDGLMADVKECGDVSVDVNGFRGPNVMGKDIFFFYITENKLVPFGTEGTWTSTNRYYRCENGGDGEACAAEYISGVKPKFKN